MQTDDGFLPFVLVCSATGVSVAIGRFVFYYALRVSRWWAGPWAPQSSRRITGIFMGIDKTLRARDDVGRGSSLMARVLREYR